MPLKPASSIHPCLLDRLMDYEPGNRQEAPSTRVLSLAQLKEAVRRDLVWLLNSRRPPEEPPLSATRLWHSVYCYGMPDITGLSLSSAQDQQKLARMLESAIATYESRLLNVTVKLEEAVAADRVLKFQIEALLRLEPAPARVYFDTTLELASGQYHIRDEIHAR